MDTETETHTQPAGSQPLKNRKHERFALEMAKREMPGAEAYRRCVARPGSESKHARGDACRLAHQPHVAQRIAYLRRLAEVKLQERAEQVALTIAEKRAFLARIVRSKPSEADMDSALCELVMTRTGPTAVMPSKLAAMKLDNDLAGDGSEAQGLSALGRLVSKLRR